MSRQSEFRAGTVDRFEQMPIKHLLANYEAGDSWDDERAVIERLPGGGLRHEPQNWDRVFKSMTQERMGDEHTAPYWREFHAHIRQHGIQRPIVLEGGKVRLGHHRLWAAHNLGMESVPVVHTDPEGADRWYEDQSDEEDWRR